MPVGLTFSESVQLEIWRALFTLVAVGIGAGAVGSWLQYRRDTKLSDRERDHEAEVRRAELDRELREGRAALLARASELSGRFYLRMQDHRRRQRDPQTYGAVDDSGLDAAYLTWAEGSEVLEFELGFRFGRGSEPQELWHQVRDLLTVRYFWLRGRATEGLLRANASREGRVHSGLTVEELRTATADDAATVTRSAPAQRILEEYRSALDRLVEALDVTGRYDRADPTEAGDTDGAQGSAA